MVRLYLEDDAGNVRIIPMEAEEVSIGRAEDNTIVLPDRNVSRHHARLKAVNGRFYVEDAGARYGLFLNGSRVDGRREVRPGDLITLGDYKVKVLPESAEGEEAPVAPTRRQTTPGIPAVPHETDEPASDTSLISLRDMERVARHGWPSDFEGRDEATQKNLMTRRLVLLAVLLGVAGLLVLAYVWVTQPTEIEPSGPARVQVAEAPSAEPSPTPPPAVAKVEPPEEPPAAPAEPVKKAPSSVSPPPTPVPLPPRPGPAEKTPRAVEPAGQKATPRTVAAIEPRPPRPASPPPALPAPAKPATQAPADTAAPWDAALKAGRWDEAERLLTQCRGPTCANFWKRLGDGYQGSGQPRKAIAAYEKARSLSRDAGFRTRLEQKIEAIRKGLGE